MSQRMTITRVMEGAEWGNDYGRNQSYTLDLELEDGSVAQDIVSNRKIRDDGSHKEPQEQEVVWGDLLPMGKNQRKLKLDYDAMKERGSGGGYEAKTGTSGGSNNSSKGSAPGRDIDASIARQVALKIVAPLIIEEKGLHRTTREIVTEIEAFILEAGRAPEPPVDLSGARKEEPDPVAAVAQAFDATPVDDTHQWLENELVVAGASSVAARSLATYAVEKLLPEQRKTLEGELRSTDDASKASGRRRLEASYVKTEGHAVPTDAPEDDPSIPF